MNPLYVIPLFVYALAATLWPAQIDGHRRGRELLFVETLFVAAALDRQLNERGYILPGLGDAGDRLFGTGRG